MNGLTIDFSQYNDTPFTCGGGKITFLPYLVKVTELADYYEPNADGIIERVSKPKILTQACASKKDLAAFKTDFDAQKQTLVDTAAEKAKSLAELNNYISGCETQLSDMQKAIGKMGSDQGQADINNLENAIAQLKAQTEQLKADADTAQLESDTYAYEVINSKITDEMKAFEQTEYSSAADALKALLPEA